MKLLLPILLLCASASLTLRAADDEGITWLVQYDGKALPDSTWTVVGKPKAQITNGTLHLADDSDDFGHYRTAFKAEPEQEIIVEARVKVGVVSSLINGKPVGNLWPWRDGAPVMLQVSDGRHQEGLVLMSTQIMNFTDRFVTMDTTKEFHTYRLIIRGTDMSMWVDGEQKVRGQGAFWKPAASPDPFIQFGSSAKRATGDAHWAHVKLGTRKPGATPKPLPLKVTMSEPWLIQRDDVKQTRPYLYEMGKGLLLMSVAQGPDALLEPYGVLKSTDAGKTWTPVAGLDQVATAPLPMLRRPDGTIFGASRWTWPQEDGSLIGKTVYLNADATEHRLSDSRIVLPKEYMPEKRGEVVIFERHIWNDDDGGITAVVWSRKALPRPGGGSLADRVSHLVRSTDNGKTWTHLSAIGPGGEPAVARLSATEQVAITRGNSDSQMKQMASHDAGRTWSAPINLEVGKVAPDMVLMSNGVLACSYGRPASCLMLSMDGGKTWVSHHVISDRVNFNYTSLREISPGRLLYVHDAPKLNAVYVDVERGTDSRNP